MRYEGLQTTILFRQEFLHTVLTLVEAERLNLHCLLQNIRFLEVKQESCPNSLLLRLLSLKDCTPLTLSERFRFFLKHMDAATKDFGSFTVNKKGKVVKRGIRISDEEIIEILLLFEDKKTISTIAKIIRRDEDTVAKYIKKYEMNENPFHVKRKEMESGQHTSPSRVDYLCQLTTAYPVCSLEKIRQSYSNAFGPISRSMVYYVLCRHLKLSWKKTRVVELARGTQNMRQLRLE